MPHPFIAEHGLGKSFNGRSVLADVSFTVEPGGTSSACSARTAPARRRCSSSCSALRRPPPADSYAPRPDPATRYFRKRLCFQRTIFVG